MKSCAVRVPKPSSAHSPVPAATHWFAMVPRSQPGSSSLDPVGQREGPRGHGSTLSLPCCYSPGFAMFPHSPSCDWSLRAGGGIKRSTVLPALQSHPPALFMVVSLSPCCNQRLWAWGEMGEGLRDATVTSHLVITVVRDSGFLYIERLYSINTN